MDCRVCAKQTPLKDLKHLFERENRKILKQINDLTGIRLKNNAALPEHICQQCLKDLELAHAFRSRCLEVNSYFNKLQKQKSQLKNQFAATNVEQEFELIQIAENCDTMKTDAFIEAVDIMDVKSSRRKKYFSAIKEAKRCKKSFPSSEVCDTMNTEEFPVDINDSKSCKRKKSFSATKEEAKRSKKSIPSSEATTQLICDQCGNNFCNRQHFIIHMRRHAGDKRYNCEICPDKFCTQGELNRHMRKHTGERPFACSHCDRRFTDYSTRKKHERIHTNERPFSCSQCNKSFATSYVLKNHLLTHTGEKAFRCEMCHKAFPRQTNLFVHYRSLMHKQNEEKFKILKNVDVAINATDKVT